MDVARFLIIALILSIGSALQSAVGFGFGLFVMPTLLLLGGLSVQNAIGLMAASGMLQAAASVYHLRRDADWKKLGPLMIFVLVGLQGGVWTLSLLQNANREAMQQVAGGVLLTIILLQVWWRAEPREHVHILWGILAMSVSGFISGLIGMGGPFIVLWVMAHQWSSRKMRVTLQAVAVVTVPFQVSFLVRQFGLPVVHHLGLGLLFLPVTFFATSAGLWIGNRIERQRLRRISLGILFFIAISSIAKPLF